MTLLSLLSTVDPLISVPHSFECLDYPNTLIMHYAIRYDYVCARVLHNTNEEWLKVVLVLTLTHNIIIVFITSYEAYSCYT